MFRSPALTPYDRYIQLCSPSLAGVTKMSLAISPLGRARFKDICGGRCHGRCLHGLRKRHLWRHCENDEDGYDFFEPLHRRGTIALLDLRLSVQAAFAINRLGLRAPALANAWASREAPHIHGTARACRLSLTDSHTRSCMSIQHTSTAELTNIQVHKKLLKKR